MSITENIEKLEELILRACRASGRKREDITLMGVSKFHPLTAVEQAWAAGIKVFGENRVQEAAEKFAAFRETRPEAVLHLIGSLQRNKAKTAAAFFDCVQSVDRLDLINALGKYAVSRAERLEVLLEMHTGEETKSGFPGIDALCAAAESVLEFPSLRLGGLMTMAPNTSDTQAVRASFRLLRTARDELEKRFPSGAECSWECLSMGMSGDFEIAVEEGSTMLRIGSAIFGERQ